MFYVVIKQSPKCHQMSLEELLFAQYDSQPEASQIETGTRVIATESIDEKYTRLISVERLITKLHEFNESVSELRKVPRKELYREFYIPKKSGGLRKIDAPEPELMDALRNLKSILEREFMADVIYHTSAFAYIKRRGVVDALKRHQANESKWYMKADLTNFFGSVTIEYTLKMLSMIFPFSEVMRREDGVLELKTALELAFLDGGLPQGTPISPLITNIIMVPVDYTLFNTLRNYNGQRYVYTRYADDFQISSKYGFKFKEIEGLIISVLESFGAPFVLKPEKTRYGSSSGRNWNLGLMINKDNVLTVGHEKKRQFKAMLTSYVLDKKNNTPWDIGDVRILEGLRSYYKQIEGSTIDDIVERIGKKYDVNIPMLIKADISL